MRALGLLDDARTDTGAGRTKVAWLIKGLGPGGAERLLVATAAAIDRQRYEIEVYFLLPQKRHLVPAFDALGIRATCLNVRDERDLRWVWRLRALLAERRFDIVHAHSPYVASFARLAVRTLACGQRPAVVTTEHNPWGTFKAPTRIANALTSPLSDATIAVSDEVLASLSTRVRARAETLTHGIDVEAIRAICGARADVRAQLDVGDDDFVIATIANYHPKKDWPNLLRAARLARDRCDRVRFCAIGQGPLEQEVRRMHAQLDLADTVILTGYRPDAVRLLAGCDAFVLASQWEGMPVALMEACAQSLPIVATAVGGIPEVFRAGTDALLVAPGDPGALADALVAVATDPDLRGSLARASGRLAPRFDVRRAAARIAEIYDECAR
jgi:glycosyltransferase involved in cell wall biosynthesis